MSETYVHPGDLQEVYQIVANALNVDNDLIRRGGLTPLNTTSEGNTAPLIEFSEWQLWEMGLNKYNILGAVARHQAEAAVRNTGRDPEQYVRMGFDSGFSVIAKFLPQAVEAYGRYTKANGTHPSIQQLTHILHLSYSTVAKFAATGRDNNRELEMNYGFRGSTIDPFSAGFEVVEHTSGYLHLVPNGWEKLLMEVGYTSSQEEAARVIFAKVGGRCLALRYMVPAAYHWSVDFASSAQELLPADIERIAA